MGALLVAFLIAINALSITAFAVDKQRAVRGDWRISESTLLGLALFGGAAGAVWARYRFRHKTRKQPFTSLLDAIAVIHAGIVLGLAWIAVTG